VNPTRLLQFFESHRSRHDSLVLATVFETKGSTYSKAGTHMLIDGNGIFQGMLSGGCLEGDLAIRAQVVLESGMPQIATYDLGQNDDEVWGLGVGCDGMMKVFLQPITDDTNYYPFSAIANVLRGGPSCVVATIVESASSRVPVGAAVLVHDDGVIAVGFDQELVGSITNLARSTLQDRRSSTSIVSVAGDDICILFGFVETPPKILLLGAGPDAEPVVKFAAEMGWLCTVVDHRQAYIDNGDFAAAAAIYQLAVDDLGESLDLTLFDMAIIMSHHLVSDRAYLRQLARTDIGYIGLLGPANRRERLLSELGDVAESLRGRLNGPAGLDIGGRGPAPIALSIIAQMQRELQRRES
jgi:xanthine/CO dehydrogenase XdhC/CoxF family maturation factor